MFQHTDIVESPSLPMRKREATAPRRLQGQWRMNGCLSGTRIPRQQVGVPLGRFYGGRIFLHEAKKNRERREVSQHQSRIRDLFASCSCPQRAVRSSEIQVGAGRNLASNE